MLASLPILPLALLPGCPQECVGAGCDDLFDATLASVLQGSTRFTRLVDPDPTRGSPALLGTEADGPDWSAALAPDHLVLGMPEPARVASFDRLVLEGLAQQVPPADGWTGTLAGVEGGGLGSAVTLTRRDLWVGAADAPGGGTTLQAGAVLRFDGLATPWSGEVAEGDAALRVVGEEGGGELGRSLADCGDVDGDGLDDVLAGAPLGGPALEGRAALVPGSTAGEIVLSGVDATWLGAHQGARLGHALACGDVTGDGASELLLGAPFADAADEASGAVYVLAATAAGGAVEAAATIRLAPSPANGWLGWSVAAVDLDADGRAEVVAGAPGEEDGAGAAWIWADGLDATPVRLGGVEAHGHLGEGVAGGDLDGDGLAELLAGAPLANPTGDAAAFASGVLYVWAGTQPLADGPVDQAVVGVQQPLPYLRTGSRFVVGPYSDDGFHDLVLLLGRDPG